MPFFTSLKPETKQPDIYHCILKLGQHGGLTVAGHQVPTKLLCRSPSSAGQGLRVWICSPWAFIAAGTACLHHGLLHGCREPLLRRLEHLLRSCTDPGLCRVVPLTYSHSFLPAAVAQQIFPPFLKSVVPLALSLMGSALASGGSVLELAGIGFIGHGGRFWQLLTEATPAVLCYQNLATQTQCIQILCFSPRPGWTGL